MEKNDINDHIMMDKSIVIMSTYLGRKNVRSLTLAITCKVVFIATFR